VTGGNTLAKVKKVKSKKPQRWDALLRRLPCGVKLHGAEVGVLNANTSMRILQARPLLTLIMIDPWEVPAAGSSYALENDTNAQKSQELHEAAFKNTMERVKFAGSRARVHRRYSADIAPKIKDGSLDFVFIDGDHSYAGCLADIKLWLPKVKQGGFISGHDINHPKLPGVTKAVYECFGFNEIEEDVNRTWFKVIK